MRRIDYSSIYHGLAKYVDGSELRFCDEKDIWPVVEEKFGIKIEIFGPLPIAKVYVTNEAKYILFLLKYGSYK